MNLTFISNNLNLTHYITGGATTGTGSAAWATQLPRCHYRGLCLVSLPPAWKRGPTILSCGGSLINPGSFFSLVIILFCESFFLFCETSLYRGLCSVSLPLSSKRGPTILSCGGSLISPGVYFSLVFILFCEYQRWVEGLCHNYGYADPPPSEVVKTILSFGESVKSRYVLFFSFYFIL